MRPLHLSELTGKPRRKPGTDTAERTFEFQVKTSVYLEKWGPPATQYRFAQEPIGREWRFDFAWPAIKIGVEIQGGVWTRGAHGHPADILRNMEKHNDAALLGWHFFQFTPDQVKSGEALHYIELACFGIVRADQIIHIKHGRQRGPTRKQAAGR